MHVYPSRGRQLANCFYLTLAESSSFSASGLPRGSSAPFLLQPRRSTCCPRFLWAPGCAVGGIVLDPCLEDVVFVCRAGYDIHFRSCIVTVVIGEGSAD